MKFTATGSLVTERVIRACYGTIRRNRMVTQGNLVICAVSGGPDSMCLLSVLARLRDDLGVSLHVAHLNHHMREQAPEDARMVEGYAESLGVPCTVGHGDIFALAKEKRVGLEEAGRIARYGFFSRLKAEIGAARIALGHNLNDQAETVLMRLVRGSGTRGLAGIPPVNGAVIRPLLEVARADIEQYCRENQLPTMSDTYNYDLTYTRNLLRHQVIPDLARMLNPSLVNTLAATSLPLRWDADYLDDDAYRGFLSYSFKEGRVTSIGETALGTMRPAIASRVVERAWRECRGSGDEPAGALELRHIVSLLEGDEPKISLPSGVTASREDGYLRFYPAPAEVNVTLDAPGAACALVETEVPELGLTMSLRVLDGEEARRVALNPERAVRDAVEVARPPSRFMTERVAFLDCDECAWPLGLRTKKDGDRFPPLGMGGKEQKLQDFFISQKVPRLYRGLVPILVSGDDIVWVGGFRLSEKYRIGPGSWRIVRAEVRPYLRHSENCATIC